MYRSKIGKLTLFILPFCLSAGVGREVAAKESGTIQITGKVLSLRGEPMEGVAVRLVLPSRVALEKEIGLTDAEGAFEGEVKLKEIGKKRFTLKAGASGYAEANEPVPVLLPATSIVVNLFLRELQDASEQPRLQALEKLVMNRLGRSASHRKVSSEARAAFKKGMRIWRKSDQPGEAEVHFARAAELTPRFAEATVLAAVVLMHTGCWTAAGRILPAAIDADPELAEAYLVKGVWENFRHLPGQAVETLGQMVKTRRRVSWLRNLELARAFLMKEEWEQAEVHLEKSLEAGGPKADIFTCGHARSRDGAIIMPPWKMFSG